MLNTVNWIWAPFFSLRREALTGSTNHEDEVVFLFYFFFSCDYLKIGTDNNQTIGKYCGSRSGQSVHVNGRQAVVSFHSDGSVRYRGYRLIFSHVLGKLPKLCLMTINFKQFTFTRDIFG